RRAAAHRRRTRDVVGTAHGRRLTAGERDVRRGDLRRVVWRRRAAAELKDAVARGRRVRRPGIDAATAQVQRAGLNVDRPGIVELYADGRSPAASLGEGAGVVL